MNDDTYLVINVLLFGAALAFFLALAALVAAFVFLSELRRKLRRLSRGPEALRDMNGRRFRERL